MDLEAYSFFQFSFENCPTRSRALLKLSVAEPAITMHSEKFSSKNAVFVVVQNAHHEKPYIHYILNILDKHNEEKSWRDSPLPNRQFQCI